ncbi:MAG TPA: hypothetical protein ENJ08_19080 [Gammaproteobacteria bacterium]|nr:hypothetical protein [Gammaproteobacteria bacterium]
MSIVLIRFYRHCLLFMMFLLPLNVLMASEIESVIDLRVLSHQSEKASLPVLLLFSAEDCDYCEAIRQHYLIPMIQSGDYVNKVLFRQVDIDEYSMIRDEKGRLMGGDQLALKYDIEVVPTIVFINAQGKELVERIVGLSGADYFDYMLDEKISRLNVVR